MSKQISWILSLISSDVQWTKQGKDKVCRKLGILGGTFEDGSLAIFIVPDPDDVREGDKLSMDTSRSKGQFLRIVARHLC